jgi:hypothetical protein
MHHISYIPGKSIDFSCVQRAEFERRRRLIFVKFRDNILSVVRNINKLRDKNWTVYTKFFVKDPFSSSLA